ncbi:MAG: biosynthetic-type acetolactate synthase large subunit [Johnsonella sp.]|nr:biosynthetic-type acetolactate synthase large subunit [Johnsonella sp.]
MALLKGAEIVMECLKEQGVDTVFGYPGGSILNIYDALYQHRDEIRHILTAHEQAASHAADGYARATGKVGVCFATSGPGATNLVTGIATAHMDSVPLVAITCNVSNALLGKDSFQEVDIAGVTMPITKYSYIVRDGNKLAATIRRAFEIARSDRPGPVLVDITKDVTAESFEYEAAVIKTEEKRSFVIRQEEMEKAINLIKASSRPYILLGGGVLCAEASAEVRTFAHKIHAPVADTLMAKGAFDNEDALYTGMVGMHGTKTSNLGITEADLLIAIGVRFSDRVIGNAKKFAKNAKLIHIDIDAAEINKNVKAHLSLVGDAKTVLRRLNARLDVLNHDEWVNHIEMMKEMYPLSYDKTRFTGPQIIEALDRLTPDDAIIVTEVGQHQMWAAQFYRFKEPRTFLSSGGLGTMGYGLGAALGAKLGKKERVVVNIAGDGCFRMNINEIATAARYRIPIIQVVLNNGVLGMVRQWQNLYYGKRFSHTTFDDKVDFVKIAEGMGAKAYAAETKEQFEEVFQEALLLNEPVVIDCRIHEDDKVFPMVSPGASIQEVFDEKDLEIRKNR